MFDGLTTFFKKLLKSNQTVEDNSKNTAKERLHLVLMQDRANVSADFLDLMKQEIIEVIKKYIEVDEKEIDVRLTNQSNDDGTNGAPALYANIPILNIKNDVKGERMREKEEEEENNIDKKERKKYTKRLDIDKKKDVKKAEESKKKNIKKTEESKKKIIKKPNDGKKKEKVLDDNTKLDENVGDAIVDSELKESITDELEESKKHA